MGLPCIFILDIGEDSMRRWIMGAAVAVMFCALGVSDGAEAPDGAATTEVKEPAARPSPAARPRRRRRRRQRPRPPKRKATTGKPIRVGLIRCDLHGNYYAALMSDHDPEALRSNHRFGAGAYFYFYGQYNAPQEMTVPQVEGLDIVKVWDADRAKAENTAKILKGKPKVCDTLEEASEDVDLVFIADCNFDGNDHLKLATPGLKRGVPTFIDKPMASTVKDALALVQLAQEHKAPILSLSILRTLPQAAQFKQRFPEVGRLEFATINGGGRDLAGHIHAISLAQHLFGDGVESVQAMGNAPLAHVFLDYGRKPGRPRKGVVLNCDGGSGPHSAFYVSVYGSEGAIHAKFDDFDYPLGAIENLVLIGQMATTRQAPVFNKQPILYDHMIENVAVAEAARRAQKEGKRVRIQEVWPH